MDLLKYAKLVLFEPQVACMLQIDFVVLIYAQQTLDHVARLQRERFLVKVGRVHLLFVSVLVVETRNRDKFQITLSHRLVLWVVAAHLEDAVEVGLNVNAQPFFTLVVFPAHVGKDQLDRGVALV